MTEREVVMRTNFNKKLDCDIFIHIQPPLRPGVAANTIFLIKTADNSHTPVKAKIFDSLHQPLASLSSIFIYLSHGMYPEEFREAVRKTDAAITDDTILSVYFYRKLTN
jgi:hypothetical protein